MNCSEFIPKFINKSCFRLHKLTIAVNLTIKVCSIEIIGDYNVYGFITKKTKLITMKLKKLMIILIWTGVR